MILLAVSPPAGGDATDQELRFRPVLAEVPPEVERSTEPNPDAAAAIASCDVVALAALTAIPTTEDAEDDADACVVLEGESDSSPQPRYYLGPAALTADHVREAGSRRVDGQGYLVELRLTKSGTAELNVLAEELFPQAPPQNQVAIALNGVVLSAPVFQANTYEGNVVITGDFSKREARRMAKEINDQSRAER